MNKYLDFLNRASTVLIPFDDTAKHLLEELAMSSYEGKHLTVTDIMAMSHIASPATVHRKMDDLIMFDYIELVYKDRNRRTKYLKLTPKAIMYFEKMESLMVKP